VYVLPQQPILAASPLIFTVTGVNGRGGVSEMPILLPVHGSAALVGHSAPAKSATMVNTRTSEFKVASGYLQGCFQYLAYWRRAPAQAEHPQTSLRAVTVALMVRDE